MADGGRELAGEVAGEGVIELDDGDNCGICLENIPASGKRFGLMNCDHVYCLGECARLVCVSGSRFGQNSDLPEDAIFNLTERDVDNSLVGGHQNCR